MILTNVTKTPLPNNYNELLTTIDKFLKFDDKLLERIQQQLYKKSKI